MKQHSGRVIIIVSFCCHVLLCPSFSLAVCIFLVGDVVCEPRLFDSTLPPSSFPPTTQRLRHHHAFCCSSCFSFVFLCSDFLFISFLGDVVGELCLFDSTLPPCPSPQEEEEEEGEDSNSSALSALSSSSSSSSYLSPSSPSSRSSSYSPSALSAFRGACALTVLEDAVIAGRHEERGKNAREGREREDHHFPCSCSSSSSTSSRSSSFSPSALSVLVHSPCWRMLLLQVCMNQSRHGKEMLHGHLGCLLLAPLLLILSFSFFVLSSSLLLRRALCLWPFVRGTGAEKGEGRM